MTDPDRAIADARLFAREALAAVKATMTGKPDTPEAMMAVFTILAVAGLWTELEPAAAPERVLTI